MSTNPVSFPTTDWGLLKSLKGNDLILRDSGLEILAKRYWRPVYCFLRRFGHDDADSKDLTQAFFVAWIQEDGFAKADSDKGRFRSFMLTSLKRFAANIRRENNAQRRRPAKGLMSLDALMESEGHPFDPQDDGLSPERIFDRQWAVGVVMKVVSQLEKECKNTDKAVHYDIFLQRILNPVLYGAAEQSLAGLGQIHGLTEKQAGNCLLTAKRAYRRLMEEEIRLYAETEAEVDEEIRDLFRILGQ